MSLKAALFDMDGTLTRPLLDFPQIKRDIGLAADALILESLAEMTPADRQAAMRVLQRHEQQAAEASELNDGARELLQWLSSRAIVTGVITRNSRISVETVFARHDLRFDVVVSREDAPPKPSPQGLQMALATLRAAPRQAVYVGDHAIDVVAGRAAGVRTIWLMHDAALPTAASSVAAPGAPLGLDAGGLKAFADVRADFQVATLHEVRRIIGELCGPRRT